MHFIVRIVSKWWFLCCIWFCTTVNANCLLESGGLIHKTVLLFRLTRMLSQALYALCFICLSVLLFYCDCCWLHASSASFDRKWSAIARKLMECLVLTAIGDGFVQHMLLACWWWNFTFQSSWMEFAKWKFIRVIFCVMWSNCIFFLFLLNWNFALSTHTHILWCWNKWNFNYSWLIDEHAWRFNLNWE